MTCVGVVRGRCVELEGEVTLVEGTRVRVIPEERTTEGRSSLGVWLDQAKDLRSRMPLTSDSVEILREPRNERSSR